VNWILSGSRQGQVAVSGESGSNLSGCIYNREFLFAFKDRLWSVELASYLNFLLKNTIFF